MCACSRERQFVRKHNRPVNRFIYLSQKSVQRKDQKCEREERKNQRVGRQKKPSIPCAHLLLLLLLIHSLRDDDDEKKTEIIKKHSQKKEKKTDAKNEKKER